MAGPGKIILLHGASSSGKSTLARALQQRLAEPFYHVSIDHLRDAGLLPTERIRSGEFAWPALRPAFFEGFHRSLAALAGAGNNLVVEHIVETEAWLARLLELLSAFDVYFVAVQCPLEELEARERARGDRRIGEARRDFETIHEFATYDFEVDATRPLERNVEELVGAWEARARPGAFERMRSERGSA